MVKPQISGESGTPTPYGLRVIESCVTCPHRAERLFCNLSPEAVQKLSKITSRATYPKGAVLFVESQEPLGVFILCNGRAKLSTSSADGRGLILRIAEPGEVLGLSGAISGKPYILTAEALEPVQANFISRQDLLQFLGEYAQAALKAAELLGENYHAAFAEVRNIGLSQSASEKLARFLLEWVDGHRDSRNPDRATLTLTHEEIAAMIGASRETVTRLFSDFKKKGLLQVTGSSLILRERAAFESLVNSGHL
jgi:CRP/FNR family transcriptional regulator